MIGVGSCLRSTHKAAAVMTALLWACPAVAQIKPDLTVMVPMSDGVKLATDVYLPKEGGPAWPVRLIRTPYGRVFRDNEYGSKAADGYAMVLQDMRGRFDSQGTALAFIGSGWAGYRFTCLPQRGSWALRIVTEPCSNRLTSLFLVA